MSDLVLIQLAKQPASTPQELRSRRGMPGLTNDQADHLLAALERASQLPPEELPERHYSERPDPQIDGVLGLLGLVAQMRANEQDISRAYLAPRDQLTVLAAWFLGRQQEDPPDIPLLTDWRGELLGQELLRLLNGQLALALDPHAVGTGKGVVRVLKT